MKNLSLATSVQMRLMAGVIAGFVVMVVALALSGCTDAPRSSARVADGYCTPEYPPVLCSMQRQREHDLQRGGV